LNDLINCVEQRIASITDIKRIVIAYSGGVDSHVLLHVCAQLQKNLNHLAFKAVYIDHGLHEDSSRWSEHCEKVAIDLGVDFTSQQVDARNNNGEGPEQAARRARYAALSTLVDENTVLLTAQHQDDQAETLMLQLLRGSGVNGLASMPTLARFDAGFISRPLLGFSKKDILEYADEKGLSWVEDSSNQNESYDRNFLRQQVIPLIRKRWPAFSKTTSRTASHCAEASSILADVGSSFLLETGDGELYIKPILDQKEEIQRLVIRQWLSARGVLFPSEKVLLQILMMLSAKVDKTPLVEWSGQQVRLFDGRLFFTHQQGESTFSPIEWRSERIKLPNTLGEICLIPIVGEGIAQKLWNSSEVSIRCRQGGETIKLAARLGSKKLKKLLNEEKILPWVRHSIPLIYLNNELAAVADLWLDERFLASENELGYVLDWQHPKLQLR